jgi:hypothetical protein
MNRGKRQRDTLAPSLFPFLAVLLCTMGALVLILMLIVSGAQTTKQQAERETHQRVEEAETQLELIKLKLNEQLREGQIQLEKERLKLQHLESHINELLDELSELEQTAQLADQELTDDQSNKDQMAKELSDLEKKLAEALSEWNKKLDKPEGDKPVFAIIPYQGTNGTHRRPIYIECTAEGVILQPEGVRIPLADLQPPYGPGNPLDAALRTIRAEFPPSNGAVTSTAYPLLVVRPNGIKAYVMARAAMRGWDDQFGYELIEEELELTFPAPTPGLKSKIASTIDMARERQAALVMAMPQRYRGMDMSDPLDGQWRNNGDAMAGRGDSSHGALGPAGGTSQGSNSPEHLAAGNGAGLRNYGDGSAAGTLAGPPNISRGDGLALAMDNMPGLPDGSGDWAGQAGEPFLSTTAGGDMQATDRSSSGHDLKPLNQQLSAQQLSSGELGWGDPSNAGQPGDPLRNGTLQLSPSSSAASFQNGDAGGNPGPAGGGQPSGGGQASASAAMSPQAVNNTHNDPQANNSPPSFNLNTQLNQNTSRESSTPVARTRGRNWAWAQGPPTATPVVRSIRLQCLNDRWIVMPESGSSKPPIEIPFDGSPRERAERLATVIAERVEGWGIALTGGHWQPVLSVEVAPDADWRFDQLRQLLEGSGIEVQRRAIKP